MTKGALFIIIVASIITLTFCCTEHPFANTLKIRIYNDDDITTTTENYDYYNHDEDEMENRNQRPTQYRFETIIANSTIICSDVKSTDQIAFPYEERGYEQYLKIINSNITSLQPSSFLTFSTIIKLYLSNLHIKTISPGAFNGLTRLKELYLDHNELTELSKGIYNSLHRLEILNLANNRIHQIEEFALTGAGSLVELQLVRNNLSKVDDGVLGMDFHLKILNLSENPLEEIHLERVASLEELVLSETSLTRFNTNLSNLTMKVLNVSSSQLSVVDFALMPKTDYIDLSRNKINSLDNCQNLDAVYVKLDHNQIESVNGSFKGLSELNLGHNVLKFLKKSYFEQRHTFQELDFSFNFILSIEIGVFDGFVSLQRLFLQHNVITEIETGLFHDLSNLRILNLSHNKIEKFKFGTFDSLEMLSVLDVSYNHLKNLNEKTFHSLRRLLYLKFDNNEISTFNMLHLKNLKYLEKISLDNNSWSCEELSEIYNYPKIYFPKMFFIKGNYHDGPNIHGIACNDSKHVAKAYGGTNILLKNFQNLLNNSMQNSKIESFFNEEFQNSKFFKFFDEDYNRSNFFKFLNSYKVLPTTRESIYEINTEKLISHQLIPSQNNNRIFVFMVIIQILIVVLLFCIVAFVFGILIRVKRVYPQPIDL